MNIPFLKRKKTYVAPGRSPEKIWLITLATFFVLLIAHSVFAYYLYSNPQTIVPTEAQPLNSDAALASGKKTEEILKEYQQREILFKNRNTGVPVYIQASSTVEILSATATAMFADLLNTDPSK